MKTFLIILAIIVIAVFTGSWIFDGVAWLLSALGKCFSFLGDIFNFFGWNNGILAIGLTVGGLV